jgi:transcription antitermination factor NusG
MRPQFDYSGAYQIRRVSVFRRAVEMVATLKVIVKIFGRTEPIELRFLEVEKISLMEEE